MLEGRKDIIKRLQQDILQWQGIHRPADDSLIQTGLGDLEQAFPGAVFPTGAIHEFLNMKPEHAAACGGFLAGLLSKLMQEGSPGLWISRSRQLFPPALARFGLRPEQIVFLDVRTEKEALWAMEEALKCEGAAAVVAEVSELDFAQSRRLQLAVERSRVTGFVLRHDPTALSATACAARWRITPLLSQPEPGMPGFGYPSWRVELLKVRNGNPGIWELEWRRRQFVSRSRAAGTLDDTVRKVG
ncbi:ImuA family protein [Mucilaginibacter lacusdianchii]|uniref:ImuA family protein n=1 Tax=Mucilaginibacter lacusdianchii TaxID=2684211 RepID=UPI00131D2111|nr:Error-prone repair protein ImuA [Mucilaginibacter sp. JXJ CY 39]